MAQKQSAQDAVSAAMSAIEDALSLSPEESHGEAGAPPFPVSDPSASPARPSPAAPAASVAMPKAPLPPEPGEPPAVARRQPPQPEEAKAILGAPTPPANDDRPAIGPIVQAMQSRRPNQAPFVAATAAAFVWLALCVAYAILHFPAGGGGLAAARDFLLRPETVLLALAALGPTILLFGFAALARRLQELRASAGSITQVALRLAEPETVAGEQVATLSQAIRREIATMGDGIERALARAAELETLVRSEVSTLERAYSDNERRIRSLIAEMADQREAIVANGGRVRAVIGDAHQGIAADLEKIAESLGERISNVGERVATVDRRLLRGDRHRDGSRGFRDGRPDRGAGRTGARSPDRRRRRRRDAARRSERPERGRDHRPHGRHRSENPGDRRNPRRGGQRAQRRPSRPHRGQRRSSRRSNSACTARP